MKRRGFTLIELLVVIAIISILAGMVVSGAQQARKRGAITKAKAQLASLETAISLYETDIGTFPPSENKNLVLALNEGSDDPDWAGPYMKIKQEDVNSQGEFLDPWGNPFVYTNPGIHNARSYDLYSMGPNGKGDGTEADDINNW